MSEEPLLGATAVLGRDLVLDLLDRLPQAVMILDEAGNVRFWSSGAQALFGYSSEEMIGRDAERLLPQSRVSAGESARLFAHARSGGELRDLETERMTRDGRQRAVLLTQSPLRSEDGGFQGVLQALTDITEHRNLLRAFERRVHQLSIVKEIGEALHGTMDLDAVLHLILVGATAGPGLRFNRAFLLLADEETRLRLEGRLAIGPSDGDEARRIWEELSRQPMTLQQMLGAYQKSRTDANDSLNLKVRGLVVPLDDETSLVGRALTTRTAVTLPESELSSADRELAGRLEAKTFAVAPLSARGRTIGVLIADNTITGRAIQSDDLEMLQLLAATAAIAIDNSRLYAELAARLAALEAVRAEARRSQQAVQRAERLSAIGEMAATVAHDIRNPLVAIGGFARALLAKNPADDARSEHLKIIIEEVNRLEGIVTRVLDNARPEAPDAAQVVQVNRILEEAVKLLEDELKGAGVSVTLSLDPGLPFVPAETDRIFEMVLNLVRNAIQAMPAGGSLQIATVPSGEHVEIRFKDTGQGVPEEIRDRIFSPFFTTKPSGSGLGLTIVSQVVREHGGCIELESTVGAGSTFMVKLPSRKNEAQHDQAPRG